MNPRAFLIGLFVVCGIGTATAEPGPPASYEIDPRYTRNVAIAGGGGVPHRVDIERQAQGAR
jgi:hypothetical protein